MDMTDPKHRTDKFRGLIDEVRIYNRALSAKEIKEIKALYDEIAPPSLSPSITSSNFILDTISDTTSGYCYCSSNFRVISIICDLDETKK